jgi:hypothetical protein
MEKETVGIIKLGRSKYRWKDNIKTNLREKEWGAMDWIS